MSQEIKECPLFPLQPEKKDGWTLEYRFLEKVQGRAEVLHDDCPSLEGVEAVLLAATELTKSRATVSISTAQELAAKIADEIYHHCADADLAKMKEIIIQNLTAKD